MPRGLNSFGGYEPTRKEFIEMMKGAYEEPVSTNNAGEIQFNTTKSDRTGLEEMAAEVPFENNDSFKLTDEAYGLRKIDSQLFIKAFFDEDDFSPGEKIKFEDVYDIFMSPDSEEISNDSNLQVIYSNPFMDRWKLLNTTFDIENGMNDIDNVAFDNIIIQELVKSQGQDTESLSVMHVFDKRDSEFEVFSIDYLPATKEFAVNSNLSVAKLGEYLVKEENVSPDLAKIILETSEK
ncbi:MAG: hypothetical protein HRT47_13760 [Candidatus Caenarcaniphilales bacterium]|nr:hypothetical protein [Candidatus Caenarcaniphilales bacterium]